MPFCRLRSLWIETAGETVQHVYISYNLNNSKYERIKIHKWIQQNFPDHEALVPGKHYIMCNAEDFALAFKLTWEEYA